MYTKSKEISKIITGIFVVFALVSCFHDEDSGAVAPTQYTVSGAITAIANNTVDSDVNDPLAPYKTNDLTDTGQLSNAQAIPNPTVVGGFASAIGTGIAGDRFSSFADVTDIYVVKLAAGQVVALDISDHNGTTTAINLDLGLLDSNGNLVNASVGESASESIVVTQAGTYYVAVEAVAGYSNYTLTIGATNAATHNYALTTSSDFVPGEVIVQFKESSLALASFEDPLRSRAQSVGLIGIAGGAGRPMLFGLGIGEARAQALRKLGVANKAVSALSSGYANQVTQDKYETLLALRALRARPDVISADLNYIRKAQATPSDQYYHLQWHYPLINLPQAWDVTMGDANVIVAVIDTGVFLAHPDLKTNLIAGYDFISNKNISGDGSGIDSNPDDPGDGNVAGESSWHGTHVAGTIAALTNNTTGVAGIAWQSKIMPLRALGKGGGTSYDIMQSVRYAARLSNDSKTLPTQRADIINLSLGGPGGSQTEQATYTAARNAGVIIVAAAGNDNSSELFYPASYDGVISVSAVDMNKNKAPYSNFGTKVDIAAPGGDTSVDRNGDGYPDGVLSTLVDDRNGTRVPVVDFYQGTSMASPHVAGVAALMVAVRKGNGSTLSPVEFDQLIVSSVIVNDIGVVGRDDNFGYGLIDAFKAVQAVANSNAIPTTIVVDPPSVNFGFFPGTTSSATVNATKVGNDVLNITSVTSNAAWLSITAANIDATSKLGSYTVTVDKAGLADGAYSGVITFSFGSGLSVLLPVSMQVGASFASGGDAGQLYVLLVDPDTFDSVDTVLAHPVSGGYSYQFNGVTPGRYYIVAGSDMDNDVTICDEGEACGAYPTLSPLGEVLIGGDVVGLNFTAGYSTSLSSAKTGHTAAVFKRGLPRLTPKTVLMR